MRLTFQLLLLAFVVAIAGCASKKSTSSGDVPSPSKGTKADKPIIKPSDLLTGKVVSFNTVGRFAVLNFPITRMPAIDQTLFLYRDGFKVGQIKITGPKQDDNIVADLVNGEAKAGDEVRDR